MNCPTWANVIAPIVRRTRYTQPSNTGENCDPLLHKLSIREGTPLAHRSYYNCRMEFQSSKIFGGLPRFCNLLRTLQRWKDKFPVFVAAKRFHLITPSL